MEYYNTPHDKDPRLWEIARKRASFSSHFATYLGVNAFLWILWYFAGRNVTQDGFPWPLWPTVGWGIGVVIHYLGAYVLPNTGSVEREYEKLKKQNSSSH